jgi:hypothetical protein
VKRTGRGEPIVVVIHIGRETTQGISLCSYLYLKLAKMPCFSFMFYAFSTTKSENRRAEQVLLRGWWGGFGTGRREAVTEKGVGG